MRPHPNESLSHPRRSHLLRLACLLGMSIWLLCSASSAVADNNQPGGTGAETMAADASELQLNNSSGQASESVSGTLAAGSSTRASSQPPLADQTTMSRAHRGAMLVGSLTVFMLAVFVGFEIITKVPPTLHTPLMSGSNAISGITVVGAILVAGNAVGGFGSFLGFVAVILAMVNVVGGFLVTHRMLMMFKKR